MARSTVPAFARVKTVLLFENTWNPNKMTAFMYSKAVESLQEYGFIAPVIVRPRGNMYEIIDGAHRWRAAKDLGHEDIPVIVLEGLEDADAKKLTLVLNELKGQVDPERLSDLLGELAAQGSVEDLLTGLPFTTDMLKGFVGLDGVDLPKMPKTERPKREERWVERTFRMPALVDEVVTDALTKAKRQSLAEDGRPIEDWQALEQVCAEYLAGNG